MSHYPANWPHCPVCTKFAKPGHITCGNPGCDESKLRQERVLEYWRIRKPPGRRDAVIAGLRGFFHEIAGVGLVFPTVETGPPK
jgi:hypothetical protein